MFSSVECYVYSGEKQGGSVRGREGYNFQGCNEEVALGEKM